MNVMNYFQFAVYAAIYFGFAVLLSHSLNYRVAGSFDAAEAIAGGNEALGNRRAGAQVGLAIAMLGVLLGSSHPEFWKDVFNSMGYGVLAIVFIWTSLAVIDKVLLPRIDNDQAIKDGNVAVGTVEFGTLVMTGTIAFASIYGDGGGIWSSVAYFVLGQATVVLLVLLFEKLTENNHLLDNIANGQEASGVYLAGKIIAYGLILMSAIKGNSANTDIVQGLMEFGLAAGVGMAFLYASELLIDWLIVKNTSVKEMLAENNVAAVKQLTGVKVGMALILGFAVL